MTKAGPGNAVKVLVLFLSVTITSPLVAQPAVRSIPLTDTFALGATIFPDVIVGPDGRKIYAVGEIWSIIIDPENGLISGEIPTPLRFYNYGRNGIFWHPATNKVYVGTDSGMTIIDANTDSIITTIPLPRTYGHINIRDPMAYNAYENCLVACLPEPQALAVIDCENDTLREIIQLPGNPPRSVILLPERNCYYVLTSHNQLYPVLDTYNWYLIIDAAANTIIDSICFFERDYDDRPKIYLPEYDKLYILFSSGMKVIDCRSDSIVRSIRFPYYDASGTFIYNPVNHRVYYSSNRGRIITIFDPESDSLINQIIVEQEGDATSVCYAPDLDCIFWSTDSFQLWILLCTNDSVYSLPLPFAPRKMTYDPYRHLLYLSTEDEILIFNPITQNPVSRIRTRVEQRGTVYSPAARRFFVYTIFPTAAPHLKQQTVIVLDAETGKFLRKIPLGVGEDYLDFPLLTLDGGRKLYAIGGNDGDSIVVIDCLTAEIIKKIGVPAQTSGLFYNPENGLVYVALSRFQNNAVSIIDPTNDSVLTVIPVADGGTWFVVPYPEMHKVYCQIGGGFAPFSIAVLDSRSHQVLKYITGFRGLAGAPLGPLIPIPGRHKLFLQVKVLDRHCPRLYQIDAERDSIVKTYLFTPDLYGGDWMVLNSATGKIYGEAIYELAERRVNVFDLAADTIVKIISLPNSVNPDIETSKPVSHPVLPLVYWPCIDGWAVINCLTDSVEQMVLYPVADGQYGTSTFYDTANNVIYAEGLSRVYEIRPPSTGLKAENYPSPQLTPVTPSTIIGDRIRLLLPEKEQVTIGIYDRSGRIVRRVSFTGDNTNSWWCWDGSRTKVGAGVYFIIIKSELQQSVVKVIKIH